MAGDWMKMEKTTPDKPEVVAIAAALDLSRFDVFGRLFYVWSWFDDHTENGNASSVTKTFVDERAGVTGFADAMVNVGWLRDQDGHLTMPNFDRHNGKSAKKRALTRKRVDKARNAPSVTEALPEKRREEKSNDDGDGKGRGKIAWLSDTGWQNISNADRERWAKAYPACDVNRQLAAMDDWLRANPERAHKSRWSRFITGWLSRQQERGGDMRSGNATGTSGKATGGSVGTKTAHRTDKAGGEFAEPSTVRQI